MFSCCFFLISRLDLEIVESEKNEIVINLRLKQRNIEKKMYSVIKSRQLVIREAERILVEMNRFQFRWNNRWKKITFVSTIKTRARSNSIWPKKKKHNKRTTMTVMGLTSIFRWKSFIYIKSFIIHSYGTIARIHSQRRRIHTVVDEHFFFYLFHVVVLWFMSARVRTLLILDWDDKYLGENLKQPHMHTSEMCWVRGAQSPQNTEKNNNETYTDKKVRLNLIVCRSLLWNMKWPLSLYKTALSATLQHASHHFIFH